MTYVEHGDTSHETTRSLEEGYEVEYIHVTLEVGTDGSWTSCLRVLLAFHFFLFERSEFLIATCKEKKTDRLCVSVRIFG